MVTYRLNIIKILLFLSIFIILSGVTYLSANESSVKAVKYVEVTQKNGNKEKLEFETFTMSWILPITLRTHVIREDVELKKDEFDEIYIVGKFSSGWDEEKEDWGVTVYLVDHREMLGFLHVSEDMVKGISITTGEEKSIPFKDVKKISFKR